MTRSIIAVLMLLGACDWARAQTAVACVDSAGFQIPCSTLGLDNRPPNTFPPEPIWSISIGDPPIQDSCWIGGRQMICRQFSYLLCGHKFCDGHK